MSTLVNTGPGGTLDLDNVFTYHAPTEEQIADYRKIRETGHDLAAIIAVLCPPCPERSTALAKVREAVMWANAGIACNPVQPANNPPVAPAIPQPDRTPGPDVP